MADKKPLSTGNPAWLRWIVFAFIGYAVFLHFTGEKLGPAAPKENRRDGITGAAAPAAEAPGILDTNIKLGGDIKGAGEGALCGQKAEVTIAATLPDGTAFSLEGGAAPHQVQVGSAEETKPWIAGLPGMAVGGVREIRVPVSYFPETVRKQLADKGMKDTDALPVRVQMQALSPQIPAGTLPLRAVDTLPGKGGVAYCGDTAQFHLTLWKPDGTALYDSRKERKDAAPFTLTIGASTLFYGIDRALLGMREDGVRTVIIPPAYFVAGDEKSAPTAPFSLLTKEHFAVADITLLKVERARGK
jgi:FKBP-type peptidyl-prolyl cis-trans isomerase